MFTGRLTLRELPRKRTTDNEMIDKARRRPRPAAAISPFGLPLPRRSLPFVILSLLLLLQTKCEAAHSRRRNIVVTRERETYDRVITDFSPEGRLSQVEYGMEAARRGSTLAAAIGEGICLVIHGSNSQSASFGKMHRIDHHIWLATSGLSGDARFLAHQLRTSCQNFRMENGEAPTTEQVARMAGDFQHYLTRTGGIRPLGCTALIMGIDLDFDGDGEEPVGIAKIFQSDPGGIVEEVTSFCVAGKASDAIAKDLGSTLSSNDKKGDGSLSSMATKMVQSVLGKASGGEGAGKMVDVWLIEPRSGNRGNMQATCFQNLDKDSASKLLEDYQSQ